MSTSASQIYPGVPTGASFVDHPTARTLADWTRVQREYEAEGYRAGLVVSPHSGEVLLWRMNA